MSPSRGHLIVSLGERTRLGAYEITGPIGKGGMGEVYRATDTRLGREVAIKILPSALASDADRLARFEREAKLLASLNHANIAAIYGLDEHEGIRYLAMELVEGETLEQKLKPGPLPVDDALQLALQIAQALEAAHGKGVIHRDLKPANIMVTKQGQVKVLDFGLAKTFSNEPAEADPGQSPALSLAMTQQGLILGTAGYMSPEQASGQATDQRADIWAFGVVLYEMLTGLPLFPGESVPHILAAVLQSEPAWNRLPKNLDPRLIRVLQRCLKKKPRVRYHSIADVRIDLEEVLSEPASATAASGGASRSPARWAAALFMTAAAAAAVGFGVALWREAATQSPPPARFAFDVEGRLLNSSNQRAIAVSPDGTQLLYKANSRLYRRPIGALAATELPGSVQWNPADPAFAPDGRSLAFFSPVDGALMSAPVTGGTAVTIASVAPTFGISWGAEGILVGQGPGGVLLFRGAEGSTAAEPLVEVDDTEIAASPQMLPGGDALLFTLARRASDAAEQWDAAEVVVQSLRTGERRTLVRGASDGRYLPSGHLVYAIGGTVWARAFDLDTYAVGEPVAVIAGVRRGAEMGTAHFAPSASGTLLYLPGTTSWSIGEPQTFVVANAAGGRESLGLPAGVYGHPRVSGNRLAFEQDNRDIWVYGLDGSTAPRRLTLEARNRFPVWSPSGARIAFQSDRGGELGLWAQEADGQTPAERLTTAAEGEAHVPESWSPDGATLLFSVQRGSGSALWSLDLEDRSAAPFGDVVSLAGPTGASFSPDGRWVAYSIQAVGLEENQGNRGVFVQPFPAGVRQQVPRTRFDYHPAWGYNSEGPTLLYLPAATASVVAVVMRTDSGISFATPTSTGVMSYITYDQSRGYDVLPDGRLLTMEPVNPAEFVTSTELHVVLNWFEELKRLVPRE